ncbi:hypothetical protein [Anaerococcus vaginimassiliensis]|uniref:hypothetical protein n=1 Tax=Anaerococcus vaginimassiliensis TaxID=2042308 RepID=UPI0010322BD5|nr:hypothetical protein [Anaerococcus vaginimassiliensis]
MSKDDYDVLVFKIILYYYGVLKRETAYTDVSFKAAIKYKDISEEYLSDFIYMIQEEYISGMAFVRIVLEQARYFTRIDFRYNSI